ncbi:MAG TPA: SRPBCC domain-containing protein [Marmoricola sp.]|nr:SRPBCC domain-containing protein [Marmoricola sp.]
MPDTARHDMHAVRTTQPGPPATGRREQSDGLDWVVYVRRLPMPVDEAWEALTAPEQLASWVGCWRRDGDAETGEFTFAYEGDDVLPLSFRVEHLEPRRRVAVALFDPGEAEPWRLDVALVDWGEETELAVRQSIPNSALAPAVAAGCEFYLDRLVTMVQGGDMDALDYDAYFLRQAAHYRRLFPVQRSARDS